MNIFNRVPLLPLAIITIAISIMRVYFTDCPTAPPGNLHSGIVEETRQSASGQILTIRLDNRLRVRVLIPSIEDEFSQGDGITFKATIEQFPPLHPYENDYRANLRLRGINFSAFIPTDSILTHTEASSPRWHYTRLRPILAHALATSRLDDTTYEFLLATILGDTSGLDQEIRAAFSSSGVAHILALSGLHVGILSGLLLFLLAPLNIAGLRNLRIFITLIILWGYAVLTGLSPSVTRAVIMATTLGIGYMIGRMNFAMNAIMLAAIVILLISPEQLFMPGFQMSFAAAITIVMTMAAIDFNRRNRPRFLLLSSITVTLAASLSAGAIAAFHFHSFPLLCPLANIPAILLLPWLLGGGIAIIVLQLIGLPSGWLCDAVDALLRLLLRIIDIIGSLPGATLTGLHFDGWIFVPYFMMLAAILLAICKRKRIFHAAGILGTATTIVCFGCARKTPPPPGEFPVEAASHSCLLIVGDDTAVIVTTAPGKIAKEAAGELSRRFSDYLSHRGINDVTVRSADRTVQYVITPRHSYLLVSDMPENPPHSNYCIVARGFRGDILSLAKSARTDTILLGRDLNRRRHDRYADSLKLHEIPFRSLR